jgi:hypothetical protein
MSIKAPTAARSAMKGIPSRLARLVKSFPASPYRRRAFPCVFSLGLPLSPAFPLSPTV